MNILITGQCTLHWGRMEYGNIGNYYIIEPMIRLIHEVFPGSSIRTTFQMSERFQRDERIEVLPMSLYYSWQNEDLKIALMELSVAKFFNEHGVLLMETDFIKEVMKSDLIIDFSGDIWGDNANFLGKDRFLVGLIKDRVAQLLNKKTVLIAGSPGPFSDQHTIHFAREVYQNFDLVTNRESISIDLLRQAGFDITKTHSLACPAFLFEPKWNESTHLIQSKYKLNDSETLKVGFIVCGWNFEEGPFDKWPREDHEFEKFACAVEELELKHNAVVYLLSHSNGFPLPPADFELIHGRDYMVIKRLEEVLLKRNIASKYIVIEDVMDAWTTKAIIGSFDILVSGRIHGAVAGLSQLVPTVIIDYGHEPKAHKLKGFVIEAAASDYLADPSSEIGLKETISKAVRNRQQYKQVLEESIPRAKLKAKRNIQILKDIVV